MSITVAQLPEVRGTYSEQAALAPFTWLRVGGPADVIYRPADTDDLSKFLEQLDADIPVTVLGVGSNLIVRDGGIPGVVIRLPAKPFGTITVEGQRITAGAAALDATVAKTAARAGIAGLEFLVGVPGTIGGALRMNAGAHGGETKDFLISATAIDRQGRLHQLSPAEIGHSYRSSAVPRNWIFLSATFEGPKGDPETLKEKLGEVQSTRERTQPIREKTGGSTFKNPEGHSAWRLIDTAGLRGHRVGDAQMSEMHCNFMLNVGDATAKDLEDLGEEIIAEVRRTSGVKLEWEIKRIGLTKECLS